MNIYQKLKPKAQLSRNGFDLSYRNVFSAKVGEILPIMCKEVVPGDHFEMNINALTRTQTLNTAAFARMKQYYHFFFVSYASLWRGWDSFISQRQNDISSYTNDSKFVPTFDLKLLKKQIREDLNGFGSSFTEDAMNDISDGHLDDCGLPKYAGASKLLDLLGYGPARRSSKVFGDGDMKDNIFVNAFPILAYNKVYFDYYSDPYYEDPIVQLYNVDDIQASSMDLSRIPMERVYDMCEIRHRNFKKDYFTGVLPDTQFGAVSTVGLTPSVLSLSTENGTYPVKPMYVGGGDPSKMQLLVERQSGLESATLANGVSVLDLRKAQALQRWKETTLRAGRRTHDQALAHFGVAPKDYRANHAQYIGGFDENINIGEVVSNADTSTGKLGEVAGKGISATNGQNVSFDVSEFGVVMCMYSCIPEADYNARGLKRNLTFAQPFDYFTPEYENLGLEAVYSYELAQRSQVDFSADVLGYAPRYSYYKTSYDEVHGEFMTGGSLSAWVTPRVLYTPDELKNGVSKRFLKVDPRSVDSIFAMMQPQNNGGKAVNTMEYTLEEYDQLLINAYLDIKAVRPMSVLGMSSI